MKNYQFAAIDFETANNDRYSACQVGLVGFNLKGIHSVNKIDIRPPSEYFLHSGIHGISWHDVCTAPTFDVLWPEISEILFSADFLVAHNAPFDRSVLEACCEYYDLSCEDKPWICTFRDVAKPLWPQLENHKLPTICRSLDIPLFHHDGLSDARACAKIVLAAYEINEAWMVGK